MTSTPETDEQAWATDKAARAIFGHATLRCTVKQVRFSYDLGYGSSRTSEDKIVQEGRRIAFEGTIDHSFHRGQLSGKRVAISVHPEPLAKAMFHPTDNEPVIGSLQYYADADKGDLVVVHIPALPAFFARIEAIAECMMSNLNRAASISVGVLDMWEDWVPNDKDTPALWVNRISFDSSFTLSESTDQ